MWQAAIEALILVVTLGGPTMFARIYVRRSISPPRGECGRHPASRAFAFSTRHGLQGQSVADASATVRFIGVAILWVPIGSAPAGFVQRS